MAIDMKKFAAAVAEQKKSGKSIAEIDAEIDDAAVARMKLIRDDPTIKKLFAEADAETEAEAENDIEDYDENQS